MTEASYLRNQFLIAMPEMAGDAFERTVTYLCEHSAEGAMGLVFNRPTDLRVSAMLEHMDIDHEGLTGDPAVLWGGPVQMERGFVLHRPRGAWDATLSVDDSFYVTTSRDILEAIGRGDGPAEFLVTLGYAGWGAGQLETEIRANTWLNCPARAETVFVTPEAARWETAMQQLGLDPRSLTAHSGNA